MKMNNFTMITIMNYLNGFGDKKLPQRISYAITRNLTLFSNEYKFYETSLNKIFDIYKDQMLKDEEGNVQVNENGLPKVEDSVSEEYFGEINSLLNIEIDIPVYHISSEAFDYDETKGNYDVLSPNEIISLQSILCEAKEAE